MHGVCSERPLMSGLRLLEQRQDRSAVNAHDRTGSTCRNNFSQPS
jgi:hypothetical protein